MRNLLPILVFFSTLSIGALCAQEAKASAAPNEEIVFSQAPDEWIDQNLGPYLDEVTGKVFYGVEIAKDAEGNPVKLPLVVVWLALAAVVITVYFKFLNLRSWRLAARTISGKYSSATDPGEITHFQALCAALSGTVGLGNIAGVAIAISVGGAGCDFLDDPDWFVWDDFEILRMYSWRKISND
ncbi:alanine:cation symporter family protein [Akkermansiaceae bacterium]|nr:alanine:cation symporter family protein [Akkermansiaceae bacterium]